MKKVSSHPDVSQIQGEGVHAPDLAINKKIKLSLAANRDRQITKHLAAAQKHLTPEVHEFSRRLASGEGVHSQMHDMVRNYSNTAARTTGLRSVEGLKAHAKKWVDRTTKSEKGRAKKLGELHKDIDDNVHHFKALFKAHHHIAQATHHMLDEVVERSASSSSVQRDRSWQSVVARLASRWVGLRKPRGQDKQRSLLASPRRREQQQTAREQSL